MAIKPFQYAEKKIEGAPTSTPPVTVSKPVTPSSGGIKPFQYAEKPAISPAVPEPVAVPAYTPSKLQTIKNTVSEKLTGVKNVLNRVTENKFYDKTKIAADVIQASVSPSAFLGRKVKGVYFKPKDEEQADVAEKFQKYKELKESAPVNESGDVTLPKETGVEALKRIVVEEKGASAIPYLSGAVDINEMVKVASAYKRLEDGTADEYDLMRLSNFVDEASRDKTRASQVISTIAGSLAFGGELATTAGVGSAAKATSVKATKEALEKMLTKEGTGLVKKKVAEMLLKKEVAPKVVGGLVKETIRAPIAGSLRTGASTLRNMLPQVDWSSLNKDEAGKYQANITKEGDGIGLAATKALGETYIETLSERAGDLFGLFGPGKVISDVASKTAIGNAFLKINAKIGANEAVKAFNTILKKAGWNGILNEMLEERVGDVGYGILTQLGLSDQGFKIPSKDDLLTEFIAFSIPGTVIGLTQTILGKMGNPSDVSEAMDALNKDVQEEISTNGAQAAVETLVSDLGFTQDQAKVIVDNNVEIVGEQAPTIDLAKISEEVMAEMETANVVPKEETPMAPEEAIAVSQKIESSIDAILSGKTAEEVAQAVPTKESAPESDMVSFITKQSSEGFSKFEIAQNFQKKYKTSISESIKTVENTLAKAQKDVEIKQKETEEIKEKIQNKPLEKPIIQEEVKPEARKGVEDAQSYSEFFSVLSEGKATSEDFKKGFADFIQNQDKIKASLEKLPKAQLLKKSFYSRTSDKKERIIEQIMSDMQMRFSLGRAVSYGIGSGSAQKSIQDLVDKTTDEDLAKFAKEVAEARADRAVRYAAFKKALTNPETLDEFKTFIEQQGKEALSAEQLVKYEDLIGITAKEKEAKALKEKGVISGVKTETTMTLEETTNTKTGEPLFKVKMADRVEKEQYQALNASAKKLGGYYSTFAKGFLFKDKESAENFMAVSRGEKVETDRPEEMKSEKEQSAAKKLREMSERIEESAEEKLNRDRKTNTARRANMASSIEEDARKEVALAKTMRNLANAIESGEAKLLNNLSTKTQIMELDRALLVANYNQTRADAKETGTFKTDVPITADTVAFVKDFIPTFWIKGLEDTAKKASETKGLMRSAKKVLDFVANAKAAGRDSDTPNKLVMEEIIAIVDGLGKDDVSWNTRDAVTNFKRLQSLGITSLEQLKATLREYIQFKETPASEDKIKQLERNVIGKKVGVDFFPTPKNIADRMVEMAEIEEGMKVLEPSAGNGNIADAIRQIGISPDVAEISGTLREILEAKGYNVVANDFMDVTEKYDRIIMNPPFSDNMDIEHVRKAYDLLKEGGKIVSIVGEGAFFRQGKKETEFRDWLDEIGANVEELPQGTFLDTDLLVTTGTNARLVEITKQEPKYALQKADITLKTLEKLKGRTTVSKQFISDLTNSGDIKQVERDIVRKALESEGETVNVQEFADKVTAELLPLERINVSENDDLMSGEQYTRFENITLPADLRGDVADYSEVIYESPVQTSAGKIHFDQTGTQKYFAHTRIEDMADDVTRRVIEVQSDLYQKRDIAQQTRLDSARRVMDLNNTELSNPEITKDRKQFLETHNKELQEMIDEDSKLEKYNNPTAHFRVVREEIRQAALDEKERVLFPTGETAMKIEGLGESHLWLSADGTEFISLNDLKVGKELHQGGGGDWIITEVLGDGKFKAVPKDKYDKIFENVKNGIGNLKSSDPQKTALFQVNKTYPNSIETFDISGKVDTNNPIYRFYEKDLGRYLKNNYNATPVTDGQGVTWYEVKVTPEMAKPVEAFKLDQIENVQFNRTLDEVKSGLKKIFGRDVPLEEVFDAKRDLGNPDALARAFKNNIKLLSRNKSFSEVIANHEGWHWYKMQLSLKEQAEIREIELAYAKANPEKLAKIKEVYGGIISTEAGFAEELMADTLADYTKTGKTTVEKIKVWFDKMITKLKLLFSGRSDVLRMFRDIKKTLDNTTGNKSITSDPKYKLDKNPEFNTGDKLQDVRLALEASENRVGVTPIRKVKVSGKEIVLPDDLQQQAIALELEGEAIEQNPLNRLWKYANKREGTLPEIGVDDGSYYKNGIQYTRYGKKVSEFQKEGDNLIKGEEFIDYADPDGNVDAEAVREAFAEFVEKKKNYKERVEDYKKMVKDYINSEKDEIALQKIAAAEERKNAAEEKLRKDKEDQKRKQEAFDAGVKAAKLKEEEEQKKIRTVNAARTERVKELSTWDKLVGQKLNPLKYTDKITQNIFNAWNNKILQGEIRANVEAKKFDDIPVKGGLDIILKYESGKETPYSERIKETFDAFRKEALSRGVDLGFRENYLPHVYAESAEEIKQKIREYLADKGMSEEEINAYENGQMLSDEVAKVLKINPFFSKERIFPTYEVAMQYGLTPKYTTVQQLVGHYVKELETIVANNELVQELESAGKILPFEDAPALTWQMVNLPFAQKGYMAPPNIARVINGLYGMQDPSFWTYMAKLSKKMQEIKLSAGLPYTTINFFAIGQLVKELTSGNFSAVNAFYRANFDRKSMEWLQENRNYIYMMARQGINLRETVDSWENIHTSITELNLKEDGVKETAKNLITKKTVFSRIFDEMFNKKTFMSFMPMMQIQLFKDTYNKFIEQGYPTDIAEEFAGRVISNNFGMSDFTGRSNLTKDKLSAVFFAPQFREGIINTLTNTGMAGVDFIKNLGGARGPLDPTLAQNRKLLMGMIITYALYNLLNAALNDDGDPENGREWMWDNPKNRKFALRIPADDGTIVYVEFMPSFLAFARNMFSGTAALFTGDFNTAKQKLGSVLSMPIKTATEIWANKDYFDRPIYKETDTGAQQAFKIARYLGLSVTHPYITEIVNQMEDKKPLYQSIIAALEFPLKFSSLQKEEQNAYYDAIDKKAKQNARMKEKVTPVYDEVQKLKDAGKISSANDLYNTLTEDEKIMYNKIKQNPYERKQEKDLVFGEAMQKIKSGKTVIQVENDIVKEMYGPNPTKSQRSTVAKEFAYFRTYDGYKYKKEADEYKGLSNENKILYLKSLKKKLPPNDYKEFISRGRKLVPLSSGKSSPVLISDDVLVKIR